ncbi:CBS-domain-containing protein [Schizopora paradoxa]|uniref:CBS-domain-containing protein n=1 Tax=Schizopora paradoxa TaxID=27342 RepID=A0A0H2SAQ2_9AGAM|nr:CBS-domain-containing protein [Schizopora paradoxa]
MAGVGQNATLSPIRSPTSVKRKGSSRKRAVSQLPPVQTPETHDAALKSIRASLRKQTSYDVFPVSFRLIVLDTKLEVKKALQCVVSAPLWNSDQSRFAGMFTVSDIIHLIQYYYKTQQATYETVAADVETVRLENIRDIERTLGVETVPLIHEHPSNSLYVAARRLIETHARRLPLLDYDTETGQELIVSVLTQYRLLKFVSINCGKDVSQLHMPLRKLKIGTYVASSPNSPVQPPNEDDEEERKTNPYYPIATATLDTRVYNVVHMFSERGISAVPIIDENGVVVNLYETVDVITLVRLGYYQSLDLTIKEALNERSPDFPGVVICNASDSLGTLLQLIKKRRVHRLVVVEGEAEERQGGKKGRLLGIISLSDVLRYVVGNLDVTEEEE